MVGKVLNLLERHDEADGGIGFGFDRDDPPIRPQIGEVAPKSDGITFRQAFALDAEKSGLSIVRAEQVTAFGISGGQHDVPTPSRQLPSGVVGSSVASDL